jgi:hypothetical protein
MDIGTMEGLVTGLSVVAACMAWAVWGTAGQHARTLARKLARLEVALASDRLDLLELPEASDLVTWAEALALVPAGVRGSFGEPGDPTDVAPTTEDLTYAPRLSRASSAPASAARRGSIALAGKKSTRVRVSFSFQTTTVSSNVPQKRNNHLLPEPGLQEGSGQVP